MFDGAVPEQWASLTRTFEGQPPVRSFVDSEGVEWQVEWLDAGGVARRVPGHSDAGPGLVFLAGAVIFHVPMEYPVDARLLTSSQLDAMVDRALS